MRIVHLFFFAFAFTIWSCREEPQQVKSERPAREEAAPMVEKLVNKDSRGIYIEQLSYFIFGVYCGECSGECATMFKYNMGGNAHTLQVDHTDSFFKQPRKVNCNTPVNDGAKIRLAGEVIDQIPLELLQATQDKRYGCPDCTDGCGVYFEMGIGNQVHRFYLDPMDTKLNAEIAAFTQYLQKKTYELEK